jgi:hypothetical protein
LAVLLEKNQNTEKELTYRFPCKVISSLFYINIAGSRILGSQSLDDSEAQTSAPTIDNKAFQDSESD